MRLSGELQSVFRWRLPKEKGGKVTGRKIQAGGKEA